MPKTEVLIHIHSEGCRAEECISINTDVRGIYLTYRGIYSILDDLVASDEPAPRNSFAEELKQVVPEESIKDGWTNPSKYPKAVRKF